MTDTYNTAGDPLAPPPGEPAHIVSGVKIHPPIDPATGLIPQPAPPAQPAKVEKPAARTAKPKPKGRKPAPKQQG